MRIKWIFSCFLAGMAMSANAKEFTAAQMDGVVQELARKFNESRAKAPPQTGFFQFEHAVARPGRNLFLIYRMPQIPFAPPEMTEPRAVAGFGSILRPIVLRNLCAQPLNRQLMADGVLFTSVFVAANDDDLHVLKINAADCAAHGAGDNARR